MKIYLSGPMTGLPDLNYPAFRSAAASLRQMGHEVYNPAEWEQMNGGREFSLREAFVDYTRFIVLDADLVVYLPGWENSPGATAEVALARAVRTPTCRMPRLGETLMRAMDEGRLTPSQDLARATSEPEFNQPPVCENHNESQKRDGNPPWCSWCGWRHEVKACFAQKIGPSAAEKAEGAKHLPWTPSQGWGPQVPDEHKHALPE